MRRDAVTRSLRPAASRALRRPVRRLLTAALVACAGVAAIAPAADASAPRGGLSGLHDLRYCEVIGLKGVPPTAVATVWNTVGLNTCPAALWDALDARGLAQELGDSVVLLNGPRHFLMDSVTGSAGRGRTFHGLRMRKVATIPIRRAADLAQAAYTDRTIVRENTWRWKKGRTVFELVAPGGDTYVMQSYAQIKDPTLTLAKLGALGRRLAPPPGWRYRARKLTRPLTLKANGTATIVQDELQDTYQLATRTRHGKRVRRRVAMTGRTHTVTPATPGTVEDHGTVAGTPFGKGSIVLVGTLKGGRLSGAFRLTFPRGSIQGTVAMSFSLQDGEIDFRGASRFTRGTGAYRGISSRDLPTHDRNTLDGQSGRLSVTGSATF